MLDCVACKEKRNKLTYIIFTYIAFITYFYVILYFI